MAIGLRTGGAGRRAASPRFVTRVQEQLAAARERDRHCRRCGEPIDITQQRVREYGVLVHLECCIVHGPFAAWESEGDDRGV